jgi:hypothetical protein
MCSTLGDDLLGLLVVGKDRKKPTHGDEDGVAMPRELESG